MERCSVADGVNEVSTEKLVDLVSENEKETLSVNVAVSNTLTDFDCDLDPADDDTSALLDLD